MKSWSCWRTQVYRHIRAIQQVHLQTFALLIYDLNTNVSANQPVKAAADHSNHQQVIVLVELLRFNSRYENQKENQPFCRLISLPVLNTTAPAPTVCKGFNLWLFVAVNMKYSESDLTPICSLMGGSNAVLEGSTLPACKGKRLLVFYLFLNSYVRRFWFSVSLQPQSWWKLLPQRCEEKQEARQQTSCIKLWQSAAAECWLSSGRRFIVLFFCLVFLIISQS